MCEKVSHVYHSINIAQQLREYIVTYRETKTRSIQVPINAKIKSFRLENLSSGHFLFIL